MFEKRARKQNPNGNLSPQELHTNKPKTKHNRRQESINCVEIKFSDLFKAETTSDYKSSKMTPTRHHAEPKKPPKLAPRNNKTGHQSNEILSLAQTITRAKDKRSQGIKSTKVAWSNQPKTSTQNKEPEQRKVTSTDNSKILFHKVSTWNKEEIFTSSNVEGDSSRNEVEVTPDARFNAILEKLRRTATGFEPKL